MTHREAHRSHRSGWLLATMLGANDGIISTSSLIIGVTMAMFVALTNLCFPRKVLFYCLSLVIRNDS